ncbi:uncharacterized protein LOC141851676 [Brevipalpus obovatus]|uniref:uncharacterized protein LOC141851676 n=1 Tax=Brevipalpus obovatus TaxID=246614 RepID=UPI003D9F5649
MMPTISHLITLFVLITPIHVVAGSNYTSEMVAKYNNFFCNPKINWFEIPALIALRNTVIECMKDIKSYEECEKINFIGANPTEIGNEANCKKNAEIFVQFGNCRESPHDKKMEACRTASYVVFISVAQETKAKGKKS